MISDRTHRDSNIWWQSSDTMNVVDCFFEPSIWNFLTLLCAFPFFLLIHTGDLVLSSFCALFQVLLQQNCSTFGSFTFSLWQKFIHRAIIFSYRCRNLQLLLPSTEFLPNKVDHIPINPRLLIFCLVHDLCDKSICDFSID